MSVTVWLKKKLEERNESILSIETKETLQCPIKSYKMKGLVYT